MRDQGNKWRKTSIYILQNLGLDFLYGKITVGSSVKAYKNTVVFYSKKIQSQILRGIEYHFFSSLILQGHAT